MSATFTSEFRVEFEAERERWLRLRFLWYTGVFGSLAVVNLVASVALATFGSGGLIGRAAAVGIVVNLLQAALFVGSFSVVMLREKARSYRAIIWMVTGLIVAYGLIQMIAAPVAAQAMTEAAQSQGSGAQIGVGLPWLLQLLFVHLMASLFIPWTPRESLRPMIPLVGLYVLVSIFAPGDTLGMRLFGISLALMIPVPGAMVAWWRHSRFHSRFHMKALRQRYGEMRQELTDARRIHEALFPPPMNDPAHGPVRMQYRYEPMRQIGGDYLYARYSPSDRGPMPALNVVIVDVTGHGIPAALTVNRLHGELERIYAEHPGVAPGLVLELLNRYVHLTLATHSVYVTAICLRVDPNPALEEGAGGERGGWETGGAVAVAEAPTKRRTALGRLEWASGGHPPAFVRRVDGTLHRLDSTTFVLGACHGDDFVHHGQTTEFGPGDVLIAYTDGATEARDKSGRMLRIDGLQRIVAGVSPVNGSLAQATLEEVERFRFGPPADDTLVVEISWGL